MTVTLHIREAPSSYNVIKDIPTSFRDGDMIILHNESNCTRIVHNCLQLVVSQMEDRSKKKEGDLAAKAIKVIYKDTDEDPFDLSLDLYDNRTWKDKFVRKGIHECSCDVGKAMRKIWKECLNELHYRPFGD